ncbi:4-(cytidine 5'-diphospho)-2-C-methyl-D-erythritol kinase [Methylotenera versatilis]|uniref:4-(cytidine 5'-diphospho)-2-C-methyl-D-erythritol kinase n=1 Tax=Methylotenera versatilis TaxID=1055487 RepID=UPI0006487186|nr:4-(cytidine 5'-diphospho)-2-C-methyl-D-erythritol kinase [Methylotenera versatilis]
MQDFQTFLAPAKINLFLHITGRRADGYHTLQSVFQLLDFYDTIHLKATNTGQIKRLNTLKNVPESQDLCVRAAQALQLATGCKQGVEIRIEKHIPMGGGLGGGSSDAATILLALNHLWQLNLSRTQLMQIGLTLGADVPVFIFGQTAWAEGIGEVLSPVNLPESQKNSYYVVLTPDEHVSTAQIFANLRLTRDTKPLRIADFSSSGNSSKFRNDLETIVCEDFPAVATTLNWLKPYGEARMSGSGASVFVAVNSKQVADEVLANKPANIRGFVAKGLAKHPHYNLI